MSLESIPALAGLIVFVVAMVVIAMLFTVVK